MGAQTHNAYSFAAEVLQRVCHIDIKMGKLGAWNKANQETPIGIRELGARVWKQDLKKMKSRLSVRLWVHRKHECSNQWRCGGGETVSRIYHEGLFSASSVVAPLFLCRAQV